MTRMRLITKECESDYRRDIGKTKNAYATPSRGGFAEPVDLIAQFVGYHYPNQTQHHQEVGEHGQDKPAGFVAEKSGVEQRLRHQQRQNAQGADGKKFIDVAQRQKKSDRQTEQEWPAKSGELAHFHGRDEPEAPDQINRKQDNASAARTRE